MVGPDYKRGVPGKGYLIFFNADLYIVHCRVP